MKILPCTLASVIAIAVAGCRGDSTGASQAATLTLLASEQAAEDPPRFSDWSAPVNLGAPVNTAAIEQGASISKDGLSLYFHCTGCPDNIGGADIYVSQGPSVGGAVGCAGGAASCVFDLWVTTRSKLKGPD